MANTEYLVAAWHQAQSAPHGQKQTVLKNACKQLGMSMATLYRELESLGLKKARKRRADAGAVTLTHDEAVTISAYMMQAYRNNNKKMGGIADALRELRANGLVVAGRVDESTGEFLPLSDNACHRALREYKLHPDQLRRPTPCTQIKTLHPNHVWEIDASISVLYYVPESAPVQDMNPGLFYKNKPENFEKIKRQRLTRYVVTDHTSGAIFAHYVAGGESIANLAESLLEAMREREGEALYGVPFNLYFDPGSGATKTFKRFLTALGINYEIHAVQNSRATGQVENGQNIVETSFERKFKYADTPSLAFINEKARQWSRWFNARKKHSRTGDTRLNVWMRITQQQLRIVDIDLARQLLTREPRECLVYDSLEINFAGQRFDVSGVPGITIGEKIAVTINPLLTNQAWAITYDDQGEVLHPIDAIATDDYGYRTDAPVFGEEYRAPADTELDQNRKMIQRRIYEAATDEEAAQKAKAKALPFGGKIDPYKHLDDLPDVAVLPRRGTHHQPAATQRIEQRVLTHAAAALRIKSTVRNWSPEHMQKIKKLYPAGVPESAVLDLELDWENAIEKTQKTGGDAC